MNERIATRVANPEDGNVYRYYYDSLDPRVVSEGLNLSVHGGMLQTGGL
jgi:hypothetical protein